MSQAFLGEIRIFAGNFAPRGWQFCNGQILAISQYAALFSLLGTTYGGNGTSNFALPNLQGYVPMHFGNGAGLTPRVLGETGGSQTVTLLATEIPAHTHVFNCGSGSKGDNNTVAGQVLADEKTGGIQTYAATSDGTVMNPATLAATPASLPHENMQPYLTVNFIIAMAGIYPTRS